MLQIIDPISIYPCMIFLGAQLTLNGAPRNIQGTLDRYALLLHVHVGTGALPWKQGAWILLNDMNS